jgi:hypothetical protein
LYLADPSVLPEGCTLLPLANQKESPLIGLALKLAWLGQCKGKK